MTDFLPQAPTGQVGHGHEANNLVVRGLIVFAVVLVSVGIVVELSLVFVMKDFSREETTQKALAPPLLADKSATFPAPRLQPEPPVDLIHLKKTELERLNGYGWIDRDAGIAHIPIDRAIEIVASRGLPTSGAAPEKSETPAAARPTGPDARQDRKP